MVDMMSVFSMMYGAANAGQNPLGAVLNFNTAMTVIAGAHCKSPAPHWSHVTKLSGSVIRRSKSPGVQLATGDCIASASLWPWPLWLAEISAIKGTTALSSSLHILRQ
jgi:hypothetical protein